MAPSVKEAAFEATILVQAFVAGADSVGHGWISNRWSGNSLGNHSLARAASLLLLFVILTQIKLPDPTKAQNIRLELAKSSIVGALWIWLAIHNGVFHHYNPLHLSLNIVLSLVFVSLVFFSTLITSLRRSGQSLGQAVRGERESLLHH